MTNATIYKSFKVEKKDAITIVSFNRPNKANSINKSGWNELKEIFENLSDDSSTRVIILRGSGKYFCAGIDVNMLMELGEMNNIEGEGRKREKIKDFISFLQACINAIEKCRKPVIAAVHGACLGAGVDIITACDMRYCSESAVFSIKEVDMGLVADLGTLQRLPKLIPYGIASELAYTGRDFSSIEAERYGMVNRMYKSEEELYENTLEIAQLIASKSPIVVRGTKHILQHSRDHSVRDGLEYMSTYNAGFILSQDLFESFEAFMTKRPPSYKD